MTSASLGKHGATAVAPPPPGAPPPPAAAGGGEGGEGGGDGGGRHVIQTLDVDVQHLKTTPLYVYDPLVTPAQLPSLKVVEGWTQIYWPIERCPQSLQSVPKLQAVNSAPGPPSSHSPSAASVHVFEQYVCPAVAIATRAIAAASIERRGGTCWVSSSRSYACFCFVRIPRQLSRRSVGAPPFWIPVKGRSPPKSWYIQVQVIIHTGFTLLHVLLPSFATFDVSGASAHLRGLSQTPESYEPATTCNASTAAPLASRPGFSRRLVARSSIADRE